MSGSAWIIVKVVLPKFEYGQLYKFAVSLGLLLVALALAVPWLILRDAGPLLIPREDLQQLTPLAQKVIQEKQSQYRFVIDNYWYVSAILGALGSVVAVYGVSKWAERQKVANDLEDTQRDTARAQFRQLSPEETEEKLTRESEEVLDSETEDVLAGEADTGPPSQDPHATPDSETRQSEIGKIRQSLEMVESLVAVALQRAFSKTHDVKRDVRVHLPSGSSLEIDDVLVAKSSEDLSIAVDIRYTRSMSGGDSIGPRLVGLRHRITDALPRAARAARAVSEIAPGRAAGLVLFVVDDPLPANALGSMDRWTDEFRGLFTIPVGTLVLTRADLETQSPEALRVAVEARLETLT